MPKQNYHYSGKSTPEAIEHFREHFLDQIPRGLRGIIKAALKTGLVQTRMQICCDGCGARYKLPPNSVLIPSTEGKQKWRDTEHLLPVADNPPIVQPWTHQNRLDFCPTCSRDGTAERAVADGVKPLGNYTLGSR